MPLNQSTDIQHSAKSRCAQTMSVG